MTYPSIDLSQVSFSGIEKRWLGNQIVGGKCTLEELQERYGISRKKLQQYRRGVLLGTKFSSKRGRAPTFDDIDQNEILKIISESGKDMTTISDADLRTIAERVNLDNIHRRQDLPTHFSGRDDGTRRLYCGG